MTRHPTATLEGSRDEKTGTGDAGFHLYFSENVFINKPTCEPPQRQRPRVLALAGTSAPGRLCPACDRQGEHQYAGPVDRWDAGSFYFWMIRRIGLRRGPVRVFGVYVQPEDMRRKLLQVAVRRVGIRCRGAWSLGVPRGL